MRALWGMSDRPQARGGQEHPKDMIQEGRDVMKTATFTRLEHEFDEDDWDEDDDDLPGTDDEELDFDELEEEEEDEDF